MRPPRPDGRLVVLAQGELQLVQIIEELAAIATAEDEELKKTQEILISRDNLILQQAAHIKILETRLFAEGQAFSIFKAARQVAGSD